MLNALIIGSTGATGRELVKLLAECDEFKSVFTVARRHFDYKTEKKINELLVEDVTNFSEDIKADCAFYCFGSTRKQAGSGEAFKDLELKTAANFIKQVSRSDVKYVGVVSSTGADPSSFFLYPQVKGQVEQMFIEAAKEHAFKLRIYRPGFLECERENKRWAEEVFRWLTPIGNRFCPQSFSISNSY